MRRARVLATAAAAAAFVLASATGASAIDGRVSHVDREDAGLVVSVDVPADVTVDLSGVTATIDGAPYDATAARVADGDSIVQRTTILAIDTSKSMSGARFAAAKEAALAFIDAAPADVAIGIVTFDSTVDTALSPTTNRGSDRNVVNELQLSPQTLLYDGVIEAVKLAAAGGQGRVLVISDGADTGRTPLSSVVTAVDNSGVLVDVVALEQTAKAAEALKAIAGTNGAVLRAGSSDLTRIFAAEADLLARQIAVTIDVPADVASEQLSVAVTLPSSGGDVLAASTVNAVVGSPEPTVPDLTAVPSAPAPSADSPDWFIYAGVGVFAAGLLVALFLLIPGRAQPLTPEQRVTQYTAGMFSSGKPDEKPETEAALAQATQAMQGVLQRNQSLDAKISARLEAAGSDLKSSEWLLLHAAIFIVTTLVGLLLGGGNLVVGLLFMALGGFGPWLYLGIRRNQRRKKFETLLPETLQLMSGSLSAGLSLMQSVDTIVREGGEPVKTEFQRVLVETRIGVSLEDALEGVADRFDSRDFRWVIMAIRIQRQVGGNLAELLNTVAATMREREYIRRQVGALSAEGKLSAAVLGGLPPAFFLYLFFSQRDYIEPLFTDVRGVVMLVGGVLWLGVGVFWMSKLVKVEV
ncbi:MAG: type II secretion system F family protein [Nocardioides sp.]